MMKTASKHSERTCLCGLLLLLAVAPHTVAQEVMSGQQYYEGLVAEYGEVTTTGWIESVERVATDLAAVSEPLDEHFEIAVLDAPDTYNAVALDGGYIVVFSGFLEAFDHLIEEVGHRPGTREYTEYLDNLIAPLVAHEISHLLLDHHSRGKEATASMQEGVEDWLAERELSRELEYDADRLGALLMARAGYPLEAMYLVFRAFDELEGARDAATELTYFRSHPRPTDREANLDIWKGHLKKNQARIDDAMMLIQNNMALDVAITLLDSALVYFPQLVSLRHNRATAWHRVWLNTLPHHEDTPATSFALYAPDIMQRLRSEGDEEAYRNAVADYQYVIERYSAPRTASQLAALMGSRGQLDEASRLAIRATAAAPEDPLVLVNHSAVHIYTEDFSAGSDQAKRALTLISDSIVPADYPALAPALYNYGLSARALGNREESALAFEAYARLDSTSRYAGTAALHSGNAASPGGGKSSSEAEDSLDGLQLGTTREEIERSFGEPELVEDLGSSGVLGYPSRGLSIHVFEGDGALLMARADFDGELYGIPMGVGRAKVMDELGPPRTSSASGWLEYPERRLSVKVQNGHVAAMMVHDFE